MNVITQLNLEFLNSYYFIHNTLEARRTTVASLTVS